MLVPFRAICAIVLYKLFTMCCEFTYSKLHVCFNLLQYAHAYSSTIAVNEHGRSLH